jgi:predicted secreted acid phosphatase
MLHSKDGKKKDIEKRNIEKRNEIIMMVGNLYDDMMAALTEVERERDEWKATAEVLGDESTMADLLAADRTIENAPQK